jgi:hypothetical protein
LRERVVAGNNAAVDVIVFQPAVPSCCAENEHKSANCEKKYEVNIIID